MSLLSQYLHDSLCGLDKVNVIGQDFSNTKRTPTVSFVHSDYTQNEICKKLASVNICAWDGHFYALKAIRQLGLEKKGGVTRLGISIYNTKEEVERVVSVISNL